ncbi:MAG: hypothetical protein ABSB21_03755 [Halobacteriota archaeon]
MMIITVTGNCTASAQVEGSSTHGAMNRAIERGQLGRVIAAGGWSKA